MAKWENKNKLDGEKGRRIMMILLFNMDSATANLSGHWPSRRDKTPLAEIDSGKREDC
jgi:hypothetical protein